MLLPFTKSFYVLLAISLGMGLFDGCFISLLGPIAFDVCGRSGATQAIGFLLGMCSIPLTVGPPIAGLLYDHTGNVLDAFSKEFSISHFFMCSINKIILRLLILGSYDLPFILAGIPPIVGALTMFLLRCVKENQNESSSDSTTESPPLTKTDCQNGW